MWHIWFMGLAAPIFAGKSHSGQKSSLSSSKCTQSWQKLLSAPYHTWKSLTLLASTEAATPVVYKTQTSHLPQKKKNHKRWSPAGWFLPSMLDSVQNTVFLLALFLKFRFRGTGSLPSLQSCDQQSFPSVLGKHDFTPKANTRPLLNLALS